MMERWQWRGCVDFIVIALLISQILAFSAAPERSFDVNDFRRPPHDLSFKKGGLSCVLGEEKRILGPSIYVYELPERFSYPSALANHMQEWEYMYAHEHILHQRVLASRYRTQDPSKADYFWVPLKVAWHMHRGRPHVGFGGGFEYVRNVIKYVSRKYSYFNESSGRNHIVPMVHDIGSCLAPPEAHNCIFLQTIGDLMPKDILSVLMEDPGLVLTAAFQNRLQWPCFTASKDIVIPPYAFNPDALAEFTLPKDQDRSILAFFRGSIAGQASSPDSSYSGGVRQWLYANRKSMSGFEIHSEHTPPQQYHRELASSLFCLCPDGYVSWSPRVYQALIFGCIPVFITRKGSGGKVVRPFEPMIDYSAFSVDFLYDELADLRELSATLLSISPGKRQALRSSMKVAADAFGYVARDAKGDAFSMVVSSLLHRTKALERPAAHNPLEFYEENVCVMVPVSSLRTDVFNMVEINIAFTGKESSLETEKNMAAIQLVADLAEKGSNEKLHKLLIWEHINRRTGYHAYRRQEARRYLRMAFKRDPDAGICVAFWNSCTSRLVVEKYVLPPAKTGQGYGIQNSCLAVPRQVIDPSFDRDLDWFFAKEDGGELRASSIFLLYGYGHKRFDQQGTRRAMQNAYTHLVPGGRVVVAMGIEPSANPTDDSGTNSKRHSAMPHSRLSKLLDSGFADFISSARGYPIPVPPVWRKGTYVDAELNVLLNPSVHERNSVLIIREAIRPHRDDVRGAAASHDYREFAWKYPAFVVNLARRPDKWREFIRVASRNDVNLKEGIHYERYDGVEGAKISLTRPVKELFEFLEHAQFKAARSQWPDNPHEDHGWRRGVLGCSLSHFQIWNEMCSLASAPKDDLGGRLILEDDAYFTSNFTAKWSELHERISHDPQWDIIYLGFSDDLDIFGAPFVHPGVRLFQKGLRSFGGGTFGYYIRNRGARRLRDFALTNGIVQPIDWLMIDAFQSGEIVAYTTWPHLIVSTPVQTDGSDTYVPYPLNGIELVCSQGEFPDRKELAVTVQRDVVSATFAELEHGVHLVPDALVKASLALGPGVSIEAFSSMHQCSRTCIWVTTEDGRTVVPLMTANPQRKLQGQPPESLCLRITETGEQHLSLPYTTSGNHVLHISFFDPWMRQYDIGSSVKVNFVPTVELVADTEPFRCTAKPHDYDAFTKMHAASVLCASMKRENVVLSRHCRSMHALGKFYENAADIEPGTLTLSSIGGTHATFECEIRDVLGSAVATATSRWISPLQEELYEKVKVEVVFQNWYL